MRRIVHQVLLSKSKASTRTCSTYRTRTNTVEAPSGVASAGLDQWLASQLALQKHLGSQPHRHASAIRRFLDPEHAWWNQKWKSCRVWQQWKQEEWGDNLAETSNRCDNFQVQGNSTAHEHGLAFQSMQIVRALQFLSFGTWASSR